MALHNVKTKEMSLVLSSDAKPRLKWTSELHQRFVNAVNQLGGAEKATPKSLMRVMGIRGLTMYHLKSHLQKYRLGRSQQSQAYPQNKQEESGEKQRSCLTSKACHGAREQITDVQIAQAVQMQMEVQKKLHEQIEVQRHLQLRIEAQGKYLQSVLRKAAETLSVHSSCSIEVEHAKAQLSELVSMVESRCPSSSVLTESDSSMLKDARNKLSGHKGCSLDSSLTSSESSWRKEESQGKHDVDEDFKNENEKMNREKRNSTVLSLMEIHPAEKSGSEILSSTKKLSNNAADEATCVERTPSKRSKNIVEQVQRSRLMDNIDLNNEFLNDFDSSSEVIDLNCNGVELFNGNF